MNVGDGYSPYALRSERKRAGLDQTQLAKLVGAAQSTVSSWESRGRVPEPASLKRLASVLLRPDWLPEERVGGSCDLSPLRELVRRWRARRKDALRPAQMRSGSQSTWRKYELVAATWERAIRELEEFLDP